MSSSHFFKTFFQAIICLVATVQFFTVNAQSLKALKTPPSLLDKLSSDQLNDFGLSVTNEAYFILSKVGSPIGQIGGKLNQSDKNAIANSKSLLDDRVLIQNSWIDYGITKKTYIPTDIDSFSIGDVVLTRPSEEVMVITYKASLPGRIDLSSGIVMSGKSMPRITVLRWNKNIGQWLIVSHADFDTPEAIICGSTGKSRPSRSEFLAGDTELGRQVIDDLVQSKLKGRDPNIYMNGYQIVFASGERNIGIAKLTKKIEPINVEAIKSDKLLAIRYDMPNALIVDGEPLQENLSPRLLTYLQDDRGHWRLIASAVFGLTQKVANNVKCIKPTQH